MNNYEIKTWLQKHEEITDDFERGTGMHFVLFASVLCLLLRIPQIKLQRARDGCDLPAAGLDVHISRVTGVCEGATQNKTNTLANFTLKFSPPFHRNDPERRS